MTGTWKHLILKDGVKCHVSNAVVNEKNILSIMTQKEINSPKLIYSPPNYHSFGVPSMQNDPFEKNTVEVSG